MSTLYPRENEEDRSNSSTTSQPPTPVTPVLVQIWMSTSVDPLRKCIKDIDRPHLSKGSTTNPSTGRRGFVISGRLLTLQLVSFLDENAMNVAQELGDNELYNYDVLVKLLSDRFDPASRVSAFRSRFHGRSRRHHEDADTFADALAELWDIHRVHRNCDRN